MESLEGFIYGLSIYPIILGVPLLVSSYENSYSYLGYPYHDYNYYEEEEDEEESDLDPRDADDYYEDDYSRYYNEDENDEEYYTDGDNGLETPPPEHDQQQYYQDGGYGDDLAGHDSYGGYNDDPGGHESYGGYNDVTGNHENYGAPGYDYNGVTSQGYSGGTYATTAPPPAFEETTTAKSHPLKFGFKDPGFEGIMMPNKGVGLGVEGLVIVIAAIIVFAIVIIAIVGLIAWLCGIRKAVPFLMDKDNQIKTRWRDEWSQKLTNISANVYAAFEKFSDGEVPVSLT